MATPEKNPKAAPTAPKGKPSLWDNHLFVLIVAGVSAVFIWSLVTMYFDPQSSVVRTGAVNYSYDSSKYTAQGLDIVEEHDIGSVTVQFEGNGTIIGDISSNDFVIYPNYSAVKGAGETTLPLTVKITNTAYSSGITATVVGPKTVSVVFDTVGEKTLPVTVEASNIHTAQNYVLSKTASVPAEVTISGPTTELEAISSVVAPVTTGDTLTDSVTLSTALQLRDGDGNVVTPQYASLDNASADVTLTVYEVRELPLTIQFMDTPTGFDTTGLKYSLSQETLTVQGPAKTLDLLSELSIANFDLAQQFAFDRDYQLPINLPAGLEAQDGLSTVTLSFDTSQMATKTLNISNIQTINVPSNCDVKVLTNRVNSVVLYGPASEIEALSADNVMAQLDCQSISVTAGQQTMPVSIQIPASTHIFATGSYTVQCQVTSK
jgi:YbbR domain-containing protein